MKPTACVWTIATLLCAAPALAQSGHGGGKPAAPHASAAPKTSTQHGSVAHGSAAGTHASTTTHTTRTTTHASKTTTHTTKSTPASSKTSRSTTTTTKTTTTTLSPVQQKLQRNTNLASKLQSRLPAGTNLQTASAGFRNLGQFVAAVNVSNNLGIPFAELKTRMVDRGMSLGQAIQDARPATTDTTVVVRRAERDADDMIRTTTVTTTTKTTKTSHK